MNKKCVAYIDGANLDRGVGRLGWKLDYGRFRVWLKDKYSVELAYIFVGEVKGMENYYQIMTVSGFDIVFKETVRHRSGRIKGNCDTELVLKSTVDYFEHAFSKALLVSSDGDFSCLVNFLKLKNVFGTIISPDNKCSFFLRKINVPIIYLDTQRSLLEISIKEKALDGDETP